MTAPFPLTRSELVRPHPADLIAAAAVAHARALLDRVPVETVAQKMFPGDRALDAFINKAATTPASTTQANWASQLAASRTTTEFFAGLGPASAGAALIAAGLNITFDNHNTINVPSAISSSSDLSFITEGAPWPVRQLLLGGPGLTPCTLGGLYAFSNKLLRASSPDVLTVTRTVLSESFAASLDVILFDNAVGTSIRPPGLRNGAIIVTPATGGGPTAMRTDLAALIAAVSPVAGLSVAIVCNPAQAVKVIMDAGVDFNARFKVLATNALPAGVVVAVAIPSFVFAGSQPRFEQARETLLHFDSSPTAIGVPGALPPPNTVAAPSISTFQADLTALKASFVCSWAVRASGSVAEVSATSW